MAKISPNKIAYAIYEATLGKSGSELSAMLKNSVKLMKNKKLLNKSDDILKALEKLIDKKEGRIRMKVISAKALDKNQKDRIESEIKVKYKAKEVKSEYIEDKEKLGGIRVEVGDEVTDDTWRNSLLKLEKELIK